MCCCYCIIVHLQCTNQGTQHKSLVNPGLKGEDYTSLLEKVMSRNERNIGLHQRHLIFKGPVQWNYNECITFHAFLRNGHVSVMTGKFIALQDFNVLKEILSEYSIFCAYREKLG